MSDCFATPWTVARQAPLTMDFPGKITGVGCHFLLQGIFLTQGLNLCLLHWHVNSLLLSHQAISSVAHLCLTLFDPIDCSIPDLPVHHQLP